MERHVGDRPQAAGGDCAAPGVPAGGAPEQGTVQVRYWAAIRAAAGQATEDVPAGSLAQVLAGVTAAHAGSPRFTQVLSTCSVLVSEQPVGGRDRTDVDVPPGATVDLLPPFAGGSHVLRRGRGRRRPSGTSGS